VAGVSDQYFAAVFLPRIRNAALVTLRNAIEIPTRDSQQKDKIDVLARPSAALGARPTTGLCRPKRWPISNRYPCRHHRCRTDLRAIIDFGWLGLIAVPCFCG